MTKENRFQTQMRTQSRILLPEPTVFLLLGASETLGLRTVTLSPFQETSQFRNLEFCHSGHCSPSSQDSRGPPSFCHWLDQPVSSPCDYFYFYSGHLFPIESFHILVSLKLWNQVPFAHVKFWILNLEKLVQFDSLIRNLRHGWLCYFLYHVIVILLIVWLI